MSTTKYALSAMRALLAFMWLCVAVSACAQAASAGPQSFSDPWVILWCFVVATLAGGTALAIRINNFLLEQDAKIADGQPGQPFVRPWLFAGAHMGGSYLAAIVFFLIGLAMRAEIHYMLLWVLLGSFGGAKTVEKAAEKWLPMTPLNGPKGA